MHWALAVVSLTLLAFAAISGRIAGTPITAADDLHRRRTALRLRGAGARRAGAGGETVKLLAEATLALVLFADASRIDVRALRGEVSVPLRLLGIGLPLTLLAGFVARSRRVPRALVGRGAAPRGDPRADGRGARSGGRHADAAPEPSAAGPERRERPQRRDLRAVVLDRARDRAGRVGSDRQRRCGSAGARADRLRHPGGSAGRRRRRVRRRGRRRARPRRRLLAPGRATGRCRARLRSRRSDRGLRFHRGVRRGLRVRRPAAAERR